MMSPVRASNTPFAVQVEQGQDLLVVRLRPEQGSAFLRWLSQGCGRNLDILVKVHYSRSSFPARSGV